MAEAAPLIGIPEASIPPGAQASWVAAGDGAKLRAAIFTPKGSARGSVVLSGGRTEPIEKYFETIADFTARGFVVLAHDWRGQGLSARSLGDRLKGHAKGYNAFLDDFRILLAAYQARLPKPWYAVGHSMGGCLTLLAMASGETRFTGAILSAPMLGLRTGSVPLSTARTVAKLNVLAGRSSLYARRPTATAEDSFEANVLTHDRSRYSRQQALLAAEPDLALGWPTWGWLDFAFKATAFLARPDRLHTVTAPVVIVSAEDDRLVDNAAQKAAARNLPQGRFISVPGAFHEILMETDDMRNIFLRAFDALTGKPEPKASAAATKPASAPAPAPVAAAPKAAAAPAATSVPTTAKKPAAKKPAARKPAATPAAAAKPKAVVEPKAAPKPKAAARPAASPKPMAVAKPAAKAKAPAVKKAAPAKVTAPKVKAAAKPVKVAAPAAKKPAARKPAARKPAAKKPA